jgi:hypothetical protein
MENKTTKTKIDEKNMAIHRKGVQQLMQAVKSKAKPELMQAVKSKAKPAKPSKAIPAKPEVDDSPYDKKKLKKGMFTDFGADKFGTTAYEVPTEKNMNRPKATSDQSKIGMFTDMPGYPMKEAEERVKKIEARNAQKESGPFKKGGMVKSSASKMSKVKTSAKPDGVAKKGLTKGKMVGMRGR